MPVESLERLRERLADCHGDKTVIVCVGNSLKGDDRAGIVLYEKLKGKITAELIDVGTVPENYIEPIVKKSPSCLIVVDAVDFAAPVGTIEIIEEERLRGVAVSTHCPCLGLFLDCIKSQVSLDVHIIGIQPGRVSIGSGLSRPVSDAVDKLVSFFTELFGKNNPNG